MQIHNLLALNWRKLQMVSDSPRLSVTAYWLLVESRCHCPHLLPIQHKVNHRFLPRDAMHMRGYSRHTVSVCPSVMFVDHVKMNKHIFKILSPSGSHTILVLQYHRGCRYSDGNPPNGGIECRWGIGRNRDSGLIAGYRRLLNVRSAKNIYRRRSWVYDTVGHAPLAIDRLPGRANYEVTKTVTDDHAV